MGFKDLKFDFGGEGEEEDDLQQLFKENPHQTSFDHVQRGVTKCPKNDSCVTNLKNQRTELGKILKGSKRFN